MAPESFSPSIVLRSMLIWIFRSSVMCFSGA
jgi:hypothetical protein